MEKMRLKTNLGTSTILLGNGVAKKVHPSSRAFVLTDERVFSLYKGYFDSVFTGAKICVIPAGEEQKTWKILEYILEEMQRASLKRNDCLYAVGGGVVGDIGGLCASLYMRGIDFVQIPTTLLSQVDSGIGGKTAVDFLGVKNLLGSFHMPKATYIDGEFLRSLPEREMLSGFGEVVKTCALDKRLFSLLEKEKESLENKEFLSKIVPLCARLKRDVVERDPRDVGARKCLNLGHTTAHAIEIHYGFSHGESVLYALAIETEMAIRLGVCNEKDGRRIIDLCLWILRRYARSPLVGISDCLAKAQQDKKNERRGEIVLVLLKKIGKWTLYDMPYASYADQMQIATEEVAKAWGEV